MMKLAETPFIESWPFAQGEGEGAWYSNVF